jgi:beta-glucanase (GH16 family)
MCYTTSPKNLYVKDSMLTINPICGRIQPDKTQCTPFSGIPQCCCEPTNVNKMDASSAQVTTRHKLTFQQGKVRIRAKMSTGFYTWPAMWTYLDWPKNGKIPASGEIDIFEGVGKMADWWSAVIHYPSTTQKDGDKTKYRNDNIGINMNESFNVFGLDWDEETFSWSVNEKVLWTFNYKRLDQEEGARNPFNDGGFHLLLDVAVGGRMFGSTSFSNLRTNHRQWDMETPSQRMKNFVPIKTAGLLLNLTG